jgi:putative transposase
LWRFQVIQDAVEEGLTPKQRGLVVRSIASSVVPGMGGEPVMVSRTTLDRWVKAWRAGGLAGLTPGLRVSEPKTSADVMGLAVALKRERPERTAAQVKKIVTRLTGDSPSESTLLRCFRREGLPVVHHVARGRFQADFVNEIWVGDALHGPKISGRKTYLFAFLDDHSRYVVAARWAYAEDSCRLAIALRPALSTWGIPKTIYVDNGSAFKDAQLVRACARLGIRLVHSAPGQPQGRGKIERFFHTVTSQFLTEVTITDDSLRGGVQPGLVGTPVSDLAQLNDVFRAWVEVDYHRAVNATTGSSPAQAWARGTALTPPRRVDPARVGEAFLWSARRTVTSQATFQLAGNTYQVADTQLVGRKIDVVYDPFDLTVDPVLYYGDAPAGTASVLVIGRHTHRKAENAARDEHGTAPAGATGIDYLALLNQQRRDEAKAAGIDYTRLAGAGKEALS